MDENKYKVILHDADPNTPEGRAALEENLIQFLELDPERVQDLMQSLPVTLKSEVTEEEAKAFAKILREQGGLVFVETVKDMTSSQALGQIVPSIDKLKAIQKHPYFIPGIAIFVAVLLLANMLRPEEKPSIVIDTNSLTTLLQSQKSILEPGQSSERKKKLLNIVYAGKSYIRPVAITAEAVEKGPKIIQFTAKIATESPGELTPEEIIRGVQLTWLEKGEAVFTKRVEAEDSNENPKFKGDAKLYLTRGELNERVVAEAILEQLPTDNKRERKFNLKIIYKPKNQFINDPYFIEYKEDTGYSIVLNQTVTLAKKVEEKKSALNKLDNIK